MSGRSVHVKIDGRTYAGTFTVDRKMLTVKTTYGSKAAGIAERMAHAHPRAPALGRAGPGGERPKGSTL